MFLGMALVATVALGIAVAASIGANVPNTTASAPPPSSKTVKTATRTAVGWHEPVQTPEVASAKTVAAFRYNTDPPTSGAFENVWPTRFVSATPLPKGLLVHLEREGDVVIAYGQGTDAATVKKITAFARTVDTTTVTVRQRVQAGEGVLVTPWSGLRRGKVDLLAWTRLDGLPSWNEKAAAAFVGDFLGNTANIGQ